MLLLYEKCGGFESGFLLVDEEKALDRVKRRFYLRV